MSRSIEHIIPESLGNVDHTLPPGVVCDDCNNYFGREVEKPFLECLPISHLRFEQGLPNKRGRVPRIQTLLSPGSVPAPLVHSPHPDYQLSIVVPPEAKAQVLKAGRGSLWFPASDDHLPDGPLLARFLAKVALEVVAARLVSSPDGLEYVVDHQQLDAIRNHARRGGPVVNWPTSIRRIYPADRLWGADVESQYQVVHEFDVLITERGEWFFVLVIFGLELAINYGGPEIDGYHRWLSDHGGTSPLYLGDNAAV
jgi:hypothetical protein